MVKKNYKLQNMKNKSLLIALAMLIFTQLCKAQDTVFGGIGTTFSSVPGNEFKIKNQFGYYVTLGITDNIREKSAVTTELQFAEQRCKNDLVKLRSNTIGLSVYYKYQPVHNLPLKLLGGFQMGFISYSKLESDDINIKDRGVKFSALAGISYSINRYEISARYNYRFDGEEIFKAKSIQGGVNYKLRK